MAADNLISAAERVLVVVAHQDDEISCSVLLQRVRKALVVFTTDGAPSAEFFWSAYGSRRQYAEVRQKEALESLGVLKNAEAIFLKDEESDVPFHDQELFRCLPSAMKALQSAACQFKPDALMAPAHEGGHPDHDACSFLVNTVGRALSLPRWEIPLYHRSPNGSLVHQKFRIPTNTEVLLHPSHAELRCRNKMIGKYASQPELAKFISSPVERLRPQLDYDYSRPPHPGLLNYEVWGWPMTGDLCAAFQRCDLQRLAGSGAGKARLGQS